TEAASTLQQRPTGPTYSNRFLFLDLPMTDLALPPLSPVLLADAERLLLSSGDLDRPHLDSVLASIHEHDVDFADLYFQQSRFESWSLEEGIVKSGSFSIDRGVGVRA